MRSGSTFASLKTWPDGAFEAASIPIEKIILESPFMPNPTRSGPLQMEEVGAVTIVRFIQPVILTGTTAEAVSDELGRLVEDRNPCRLLLNFGKVESLTSLMLGKLITLHNRAQTAGGRLALCALTPDVYQIFEVIRLTEYLNIYPDEPAALRSFEEG
jgi:anti-anti-sigma factor